MVSPHKAAVVLSLLPHFKLPEHQALRLSSLRPWQKNTVPSSNGLLLLWEGHQTSNKNPT